MRSAFILAALLVGATLVAPTAAALPPTWTPTLIALVNALGPTAYCLAQEVEERVGLDDGCPPPR